MLKPKIAALISVAILLCSCGKGMAERVESVNITEETESQNSELILVHKSAIAVAIPRNRLQPRFVEMRPIQDGRIMSDSFSANISIPLSASKKLSSVEIWCILDVTEEGRAKRRDRNLSNIEGRRMARDYTEKAIPGSSYGAFLPNRAGVNVFDLYKIGENDGRLVAVCHGDDSTGIECGVYAEYKGMLCEYVYEFTTLADTDNIIEQAESFLSDALANGEELMTRESE